MNEQRPPLPPFTHGSAIQKVHVARDGLNSHDTEKVTLAYTVNSEWRDHNEFVHGRRQIVEFLQRKWRKEQQYRLIKESWTRQENHIAVRFTYEWCDGDGNWFRSYDNENWEFDKHGLMQTRCTCISDLPITESERLLHQPQGHRPDDHLGLSELGLQTGARRRVNWLLKSRPPCR